MIEIARTKRLAFAMRIVSAPAISSANHASTSATKATALPSSSGFTMTKTSPSPNASDTRTTGRRRTSGTPLRQLTVASRSELTPRPTAAVPIRLTKKVTLVVPGGS